MWQNTYSTPLSRMFFMIYISYNITEVNDADNIIIMAPVKTEQQVNSQVLNKELSDFNKGRVGLVRQMCQKISKMTHFVAF